MEIPCRWPFDNVTGEGKTPETSYKLKVWAFEGGTSWAEEGVFAVSADALLEIPRRPSEMGLESELVFSGVRVCALSFWGNGCCVAVATAASTAVSSISPDSGRCAVEIGEGTMYRSKGWIEGERAIF